MLSLIFSIDLMWSRIQTICQTSINGIFIGDDEQTESLVTLVVAPVSQLFASIPQLTACRVAGLQDFFTHYKPDQSPAKSVGSEASTSTTLSSSVSDDHVMRIHPVTSSGKCSRLFYTCKLFLMKRCEIFIRICRIASLISEHSWTPSENLQRQYNTDISQSQDISYAHHNLLL